MIDWTKSVSMINSISFLALALEEYSLSHTHKGNDKEILQISSLLLAIAGIHYSILDVNKPSPTIEMYIRYSDWILTTPLLLLVLGKYYKIDTEKILLWIFLDLIMIIGGLIYELNNDYRWWVVGTVAYITLLGVLVKDLPQYDLLIKYFVIGWGFYGIVALLPLEQRFFYFNILDFYNKFVFAYDIRLRLLN